MPRHFEHAGNNPPTFEKTVQSSRASITKPSERQHSAACCCGDWQTFLCLFLGYSLLIRNPRPRCKRKGSGTMVVKPVPAQFLERYLRGDSTTRFTRSRESGKYRRAKDVKKEHVEERISNRTRARTWENDRVGGTSARNGERGPFHSGQPSEDPPPPLATMQLLLSERGARTVLTAADIG